MDRRSFFKSLAALCGAAVLPLPSLAQVPRRPVWRDPRVYRFDKWIFPVIANMTPPVDLIEDLLSVQPIYLIVQFEPVFYNTGSQVGSVATGTSRAGAPS